MAFINNATIAYDNEIQVVQLDDTRLELRQRWLADEEYSTPFIIQADELRELVALAKYLGWEL